MFSSVLPEEIERMIWKSYFERHVLSEITSFPWGWPCVMEHASKKLINMVGCDTGESGQIQGYNDIRDIGFIFANFFIPDSADDCFYDIGAEGDRYWEELRH